MKKKYFKTVRYFVNNQQVTLEELQEIFKTVHVTIIHKEAV